MRHRAPRHHRWRRVAVAACLCAVACALLRAGAATLGVPAAVSRATRSATGPDVDGAGEGAPASPADGAAWAQDGSHGLSYACVTATQQALYDALLEGISAREESFGVGAASTDDLQEAMRALMEDHPELFWLDGSLTVQGSVLGGGVVVTPALDMEPDQVDAVREEIDAEVDGWLDSLPDEASAYDKVRSAYEWVIDGTDYDESAEQGQNIQSVFLSHRSVCAGYAKAFQYLLLRAGVPCAYVTGQIDEGAHAWDLVCIDGTCTYVDPTWGDPTYLTQQGQEQDGNISYDYLCLTTEEMERDHHVADRAAQLPGCSSTDYDWYRLRGTFLASLDSQAIADGFWDSVEAGEDEVGYKFADDEAYEQAASLLEAHGFLQSSLSEYGRQRGLSQVSYSYTVSPELRVVKVLW